MKPSWQQVRVNSTEGGAWMPEWCKNVYKHPKMRQVNWWQTMASWSPLKVQIERLGGASYTSKFMFWGKIGLIWAKPAQIWSVPMSNVSMTNTGTVPAGGSINIAGSKDTSHLSHLKWTKRSSKKSSRKWKAYALTPCIGWPVLTVVEVNRHYLRVKASKR